MGAQDSLPVTEKRSGAKFIWSENKYDRTVTFLIRTHVSTKKPNSAVEPPYSPAAPLSRRIQCKQS